MKWFPKLILSVIAVSSYVFAQTDNPANYVLGSAEVDSYLATFYFENVSKCQLDTVDVRVLHNHVYLTTDETSLNVALAPGESGKYVVRLSRVVNSDWQWALDGVSLSNCAEAGKVAFAKQSFGEAQVVAAADPGSSSGSQLTYTIAKGDTVFIIADKFGISARELMSANGLTSEALIFGRTLSIPVSIANPTTTFRTHTVVAGDTLFSLSQQYQTNMSVIENANCLEDGVVQLGQKLRIPPEGVSDVVGDCR
jgi:LysM repeat protein